MVFDIAVAGHRIGQVVLLELAEKLGIRLADDVGQDVQATPVGHAQDDLLEIAVGSRFHHAIK